MPELNTVCARGVPARLWCTPKGHYLLVSLAGTNRGSRVRITGSGSRHQRQVRPAVPFWVKAPMPKPLWQQPWPWLLAAAFAVVTRLLVKSRKRTATKKVVDMYKRLEATVGTDTSGKPVPTNGGVFPSEDPTPAVVSQSVIVPAHTEESELSSPSESVAPSAIAAQASVAVTASTTSLPSSSNPSPVPPLAAVQRPTPNPSTGATPSSPAELQPAQEAETLSPGMQPDPSVGARSPGAGAGVGVVPPPSLAAQPAPQMDRPPAGAQPPAPPLGAQKPPAVVTAERTATAVAVEATPPPSLKGQPPQPPSQSLGAPVPPAAVSAEKSTTSPPAGVEAAPSPLGAKTHPAVVTIEGSAAPPASPVAATPPSSPAARPSPPLRGGSPAGMQPLPFLQKPSSQGSPSTFGAQLHEIQKAEVDRYYRSRSKTLDEGFAEYLKTQMVGYEQAVTPFKRDLFLRMWRDVSRSNGSVTAVELGIGTFHNAPYYALHNAPPGMDVIGIDPNESMEPFAQRSAAGAGFKLRFVKGVAEELPLHTDSVDVVVSTATLCSVSDAARAISEIQRVLKPGGCFLFVEHVLSQTSTDLAEKQRQAAEMLRQARASANPTEQQAKIATYGCRTDLRTLEIIQAAGFREVDGSYFELPNFGYTAPTAAGIAIS